MLKNYEILYAIHLKLYTTLKLILYSDQINYCPQYFQKK